MKTEYKDFAPRIGVSYSPGGEDGWSALGVGVFFNQDIGNARIRHGAQYRRPHSRGQRQSRERRNIFWNNALAAISGGAKAQITSPFAFVDAYSHRTSYTFEYLMNVQRQLSNNWVVEVGYLGSLSRHLYGFLDANQPIPGRPPSLRAPPLRSATPPATPSRSNSASSSW